MIGSPGIKRATHIDDSIKMSVFTARDEIVSGDLASIRFMPNGSSTGGAITLENARGSVQLRINWLTGAVTQDLRQGR